MSRIDSILDVYKEYFKNKGVELKEGFFDQDLKKYIGNIITFDPTSPPYTPSPLTPEKKDKSNKNNSTENDVIAYNLEKFEIDESIRNHFNKYYTHVC